MAPPRNRKAAQSVRPSNGKAKQNKRRPSQTRRRAGTPSRARTATEPKPRRQRTVPSIVNDLHPLLSGDGAGQEPCAVRLIAGVDGHPVAAVVVRRTAIEPALSQAWQRYDGYVKPDPFMVTHTTGLLIDEAADAVAGVLGVLHLPGLSPYDFHGRALNPEALLNHLDARNEAEAVVRGLPGVRAALARTVQHGTEGQPDRGRQWLESSLPELPRGAPIKPLHRRPDVRRAVTYANVRHQWRAAAEVCDQVRQAVGTSKADAVAAQYLWDERGAWDGRPAAADHTVLTAAEICRIVSGRITRSDIVEFLRDQWYPAVGAPRPSRESVWKSIRRGQQALARAKKPVVVEPVVWESPVPRTSDMKVAGLVVQPSARRTSDLGEFPSGSHSIQEERTNEPNHPTAQTRRRIRLSSRTVPTRSRRQ